MHSAPIVCTSVLFIHISIVFLFRFLALKSFSPDVVIQFVYHVLSVPGSMFHLYCSSPNVIDSLLKVEFFSQVTKVLLDIKSFASGLNSNSAISIVCNLLYLASHEGKTLLDRKKKNDSVNLMLQLLPLCEDTGIKPESNACFWHPLFGWCKGEIDVRLLRLFTYVQKQLQCLWHPAFVKVFFSDVLEPNPGISITSSRNSIIIIIIISKVKILRI
jgi:hypothetical protein